MCKLLNAWLSPEQQRAQLLTEPVKNQLASYKGAIQVGKDIENLQVKCLEELQQAKDSPDPADKQLAMLLLSFVKIVPQIMARAEKNLDALSCTLRN